MKSTNSLSKVMTTSTNTFGNQITQRVVMNSDSSYGKVSGGFGPLRFSYEGKNPIGKLAAGIAIGVLGTVIIRAANVAIPITVTWGLKKLGICDGKKNETLPSPTGSSTPSSPAPKFAEGTFADDVARAISKGEPKRLLAEEIVQGSRIILFSSPGVGKSIVVNQMAIAIASGKKCGLFPDEVDAEPQNVLLIDTEQEDEDLYIRYGNGLSEIPDNITRVSDCQFNSPDEVASYIRGKVSQWTSNGTVIVDNITSSFSLQSPEKIRVFYNQLRSIQDEMRGRGVIITYIMLCHETKSSKGLTLKSLQGSGNLGNFATAVYGLERVSEDLIEFKVLKNRRSKNNGSAYLEKRCEEPYLRFEFQNVVGAVDNTKVVPEMASEPITPETPANTRKCSEEQIKEIRRLYDGGMSINKLHLKYNIHPRIVRKYLGLKH